MSQPGIRRYKQELKRSVRGYRLKKHLVDAFEISLAPFLEDIPSPSYEDLVDAFGPPEHLSDSLLHNINIEPIPFKIKICIGSALLIIIGFVGFGLFSLQNAPEYGTVLNTDDNRLTPLYETGTYIASDNFSHNNFTWDFPRDMTTYLLETTNTGESLTNVFVYYSDHQPPHTFELHPGDSKTLLVVGARSGEHSIVFNSSNGTLSGTFQVLASDESIT